MVTDHTPPAAGGNPGEPRPRRPRGVVALAWGTGALLALVPLTGASAAPRAQDLPPLSDFEAGRYVVTLAQKPLADYDGTVPGIPRFKAQADGRPDLAGAPAQRYRRHLEQQQSDVAAAVGARPAQRYTVALNGFAAELSAAQAQKLAGTPGVLSVVEDELRQPQTTDTPAYLGLSGPDGVWAGLGGVEKAGAGVVVGVLDTGVWPESPSFQGEKLGTKPVAGKPYLAYRRSDGRIVQTRNDGGTFTGVCQTGERWTAAQCNTKIIGARWFAEGFFADGDEEDAGEHEFLSPRDGDGHGSHTAGTAVGRTGVEAVIDGASYGTTSGMAPAASLAVYKVCWSSTTDAGCATSDLVAAIDAAVEDGVDVINYSIGGGAATTVADPVELAFLSAASAGIFVAASAGNDGPGESTLDHASPWVTTVAASTAVPREGTVVLGDGRKFVGARLTREPLPRTPLVLSTAVSSGDAEKARLCLAGSLDPAKAKGKVVLCYRGENPRVEKSAEVERAGGVGMVLVNPTPSSVDPDLHAVPTVHLDTTAGQKVADYAGRAGATVAFEVGNTTGRRTPTPQVAGFSSRGPTLASDADVLKPDISAPGVGIIAAVAPGPNGGNGFSTLSGTSMSAPHIAGLAALYLGVHPRWSPMAVKSAMMTTARDHVGGNGRPARDPFAAGAGFVDPRRFFDPGLVYDSGPRDWLAFIEGSGIDTGTDVAAVDPSDLNQPSIAIGSLVGTQTVRRSVTAVKPGLYRAEVSVPGVDVRVTPSVLNFNAAGETKSFTVTFTVGAAELDSYTSGFLTWRGADTSVRSPLAVRPVALDAPEEVAGRRTTGSVTVPVRGGTDGVVDLVPAGLAPGKATTATLEEGDLDEYVVEVPEDTAFARFEVIGADERADLDLGVFRVEEDGEIVDIGLSATLAADERVDVLAPEPGTYVAVVLNFANAPGTSSTGYTHTSFVVEPKTSVGRFTVTPDPLPLTLGETSTYTASWKGLEPRRRYLGVVGYGSLDEEALAPPTVVTVG
ncbi:hypothetical protein NUM3379_07750 [Kineococcus sp. NUM-3379]